MSWLPVSDLKILYVGTLGPKELCRTRMLALAELGPTVVPFDYDPYTRLHRESLAVRAIRKAVPRLFLASINDAFAAAVEASRPHIVWVDKGVYFTEATMQRVMNVRSPSGERPVFLHFHPDDAFNAAIYHDLYEKTLRYYDCHFIPHRWVIGEHLDRGARRVEFWPFGFHPPVHRPVTPEEAPAPDLAVDVAFVGRWEPGRADDLERLARQGLHLGVWGTIWERLGRDSALRPHVRWRSAVGTELASIASLSKISLGFLSDTNRDGHTSRTFEIPACGGFMLAKRSAGQQEFFEEGKDAEFFGSFEELQDKIRYYLAHDQLHEKIRAAGLKRCHDSGYSYANRFRFALEVARECHEAIGAGRQN